MHTLLHSHKEYSPSRHSTVILSHCMCNIVGLIAKLLWNVRIWKVISLLITHKTHLSYVNVFLKFTLGLCSGDQLEIPQGHNHHCSYDSFWKSKGQRRNSLLGQKITTITLSHSESVSQSVSHRQSWLKASAVKNMTQLTAFLKVFPNFLETHVGKVSEAHSYIKEWHHEWQGGSSLLTDPDALTNPIITIIIY